MSREVRVYRDKIWLWGEPKRQLLLMAEELGVEPAEAFNRVFDRGYELWLAERNHGEGPRSSTERS